MTGRCWDDEDVTGLGASDVELGSLQIAVQIVDVDKAIVLALGKYFTILPRH